MGEEIYSHIISILVENKSGVIQRVTGLFTRRGFNIDSRSSSRQTSLWMWSR